MEFGEDQIEKLKNWKQRKNIDVKTKTHVESKSSLKSPTAAFCPWTEDQVRIRAPSFEDSPIADIDILAERNFECLLDYDADKEEKLNFW